MYANTMCVNRLSIGPTQGLSFCWLTNPNFHSLTTNVIQITERSKVHVQVNGNVIPAGKVITVSVCSKAESKHSESTNYVCNLILVLRKQRNDEI